MALRINEQLFLVVPIDRENGGTVYVHAQPIGREVFDRYWLPLSKAFARMYAEGLGVVTGPRIAARMLRMVAEESGSWDGPEGVRAGLVEEIHRLTNVIAPGAGSNGSRGAQFIAYDDALKQGMLDEDDADLVEGALVFFTLVWRMHAKSDRLAILNGAVALWGAQTSALNLSAFAASLPTSIATDNTGAISQEASSPPSSTGHQATGLKQSSVSVPPTSRGVPLTNTANAI